MNTAYVAVGGATSRTEATAYGFDRLNRRMSESLPGGTHQHLLLGKLTSMTDAAGTVSLSGAQSALIECRVRCSRRAAVPNAIEVLLGGEPTPDPRGGAATCIAAQLL